MLFAKSVMQRHEVELAFLIIPGEENEDFPCSTQRAYEHGDKVASGIWELMEFREFPRP